VTSLVAVALALSGCGTRVDDAERAAASGGGTVTLSPESIQALTRLRGAVASPPLTPGTEGSAGAPLVGVGPRDVQQTTPDAHMPASPAASESRPGSSLAATAPAGGTGCRAALAPVAIGQIGFFSGVLGPISGSARTALAAWARDINARGGLACHPMTLYSSDDAGDAARSAYLVQDMVDRHHVVAFVASAVVIQKGFLQAIAKVKVPAIGGPGFAEWRSSPWVFPESADGGDLTWGLIRNGVEQGKRRLGLVYCVEVSSCTEGADYFKSSAEPAGAELVYSAPGSITQTDYTANCLNARNAGVDQLTLLLDGASVGRMARSCEAIGYRPLLSTSAALFSPGQAADPLVRSFGVASSTGSAPWMLDDTPGLREYHRVLSAWAPATPPDAWSMIAFTSAKLLEAALAQVASAVARGPITPELVLQGLGDIRNESLGGLTVGLSFRPGQAHGTSGCVFLEQLGTAGWTAPRGSHPVCRPGN
jgi:branched-chain amino acid transport system substrate-binding protein